MNLKEIQLKKAVDQATMQHLQKGKFPSFAQVNQFIRNKFRYSMAGLPIFRPLFGRKYECSNPKEYNFMIDNIKSDLDDLYDADSSCNNEILSAFNYYDTEKKKIEATINDVQNRLDNMLYGFTMTQGKGSIYDNFDDFSKIDFIGDQDRGIPHTDALIDLLTKSVSNDTLTDDSKIPLKDATTKIDVASSVLENIMLSDINNCLSDNVNEVWIQKIQTNNDNGIIARLLIELPEEQEITTIRYDLQSPRKTTIKLSISDAQKQIRNLKKIETLHSAQWNIKKTKAKVLIFEISKTQPDSINGVNFEYFIGAKNISIFNDHHKIKGLLVSKPYKINQLFNSVYLNAEQSIPPDTLIKYFIGIDTLDNQINWMKIRNNAITDIGLLNPVKSNIAEEFSLGFGQTIAGGGYCLVELPHEPVPNTVKLYIGNNMWEKRTCSIDNPDNFALKDLIVNGKLEYIKMNAINFNQPKSSASIYTSYVYCETPAAVEAEIGVSESDATATVYVNSIKTEKIDGKYILRLSAGWNKIQILCLSTLSDIVLTINAYFNEVASAVRAHKDNIKEVSTYDLIYNFHRTTYDHYAVGTNKIMLNFDPREIGLEATIEYMYIDDASILENMHIRFMAILLGDAKDVTPKLFNYKILTC